MGGLLRWKIILTGRGWLMLAIPLMLAVLVGLFTIDGDFVRDDVFAIKNNPIVIGSLPVSQVIPRALNSGIWGEPISGSICNYRPLLPIIWNLLWRIDQGSPLIFRIFSLILHVTATTLVFLLGRQLFDERRVAFFGAAIFAVHPVHAEVLGGLVTHGDMLSAILGVAAILLSCRASGSEPASIRYAVMVPILFSLACLAKESAIVFAPVLIILPFLKSMSSSRRRWLEVLAVLIPALCFIIFQLHLIRPKDGYSLAPVNEVTTIFQGVLVCFYVIWQGIQFCILPINLAPSFHDYAQIDLDSIALLPYAIPGLIFLAVGVWAGILSWRRKQPALFIPVAILFGPILMMTNHWSFPTAFAERLLYGASIGSSLLLAAIMARIRSETWRNLILFLVVVSMFCQSWYYQRPWRNEFELFQAGTQLSPFSTQANRGYSLVLFRQDRILEGAWYFLVYKYLMIMHSRGIPKRIFADELRLVASDSLAPPGVVNPEQKLAFRLLEAPQRLFPGDPCYLVRNFLMGLELGFPGKAAPIKELYFSDSRYGACLAKAFTYDSTPLQGEAKAGL